MNGKGVVEATCAPFLDAADFRSGPFLVEIIKAIIKDDLTVEAR